VVRPTLHGGPAVAERAQLPGIGVTVVLTSRTSSAPAAIALVLGYLAAFVLIVRYALPHDLTCVTNPRHPLR
jgi:hypothetical protein